MKKKEIIKLQPTATSRTFRYKMKKADYYREFGKKRQKPGFFPTALAWVIRVLPKVGPLKSLKLKEPGPEAEKLFIQSFDSSLARYAEALKNLHNGNYPMANIDFDTGKKTFPGEYKLADKNYGELLIRLSNKKFDHVNAELKQNILAFFNNPNVTVIEKEDPASWGQILSALEELKAL